MLKEIPSSQGKRTDIETSSLMSEEVKPKPKTEVIEDLGFNRQQASQFQQMAEHEDVVLEAISEAMENKSVPVCLRRLNRSVQMDKTLTVLSKLIKRLNR